MSEPLPPALADRAIRMRKTKTIKRVAAELGVSVYKIKMATTPGFADKQRASHRRSDAKRAVARAADPKIKTYKAEHYRTTKGLKVDDALDLADRLIERRRQRGLDQADVAAKLGVTLTTYQTWEAGRCPKPMIGLVTWAIKGMDA